MQDADKKLQNIMSDKKPYEINADKLLIITDIHQDVSWFQAVISREKGNYDHILFNGDFIDSYYSPPRVYGAGATAEFMVELINGGYGPVSLNCGNHDLPVMECWKMNQEHSNKKHIHNCCSGFTNSKAKEVNKVFSWADWRKFHLFHTFAGHLISHAGFHPSYWNFYKSTEENLDHHWKESEEALELISFKPSIYFAAGLGRGGSARFGSPCWLDWDTEFDNGVPLEQIVGHSANGVVRNIENNYCFDTKQSGYILLDKNGIIEFKSIVQDEVSNLWKDQKPLFRDDTESKQTISKNFKY